MDKTSLVAERRISGSQSSITRVLKSNKCTQQPFPFFFNQNFKRILQIVCPHKSSLETISSPRGSSTFLSRAQFLLWKEGNFWQSTHNKRKEKSSQTNCRLGEHRPWTLARSKPVKQTSLTTLGTRATAGGRKTICIYTPTDPYFLHRHEPFPLRKKKYIYKFFLSLSRSFHLSSPSSYNVFQLLCGP